MSDTIYLHGEDVASKFTVAKYTTLMEDIYAILDSYINKDAFPSFRISGIHCIKNGDFHYLQLLFDNSWHNNLDEYFRVTNIAADPVNVLYILSIVNKRIIEEAQLETDVCVDYNSNTGTITVRKLTLLQRIAAILQEVANLGSAITESSITKVAYKAGDFYFTLIKSSRFFTVNSNLATNMDTSVTERTVDLKGLIDLLGPLFINSGRVDNFCSKIYLHLNTIAELKPDAGLEISVPTN